MAASAKNPLVRRAGNGCHVVVHAVADAFDLGEPLSAVEVMRGAMGLVHRLETDKGTYAVKELFAWNPGENAEVEAESTAAARSLGLTAPAEVRSPSGELVVAIDGVRYRVHAWLDLDHRAERSPALVGDALGRLHRQARPDDGALDPWYDTPPTEARWDAIERSAADTSWGAGLARHRPHLRELGALERPRQPRVRCHRDLMQDNVVPLSAGGIALLDWENVGPLEPDQELGCVLAWTPAALPAYLEAACRDVRLTSGTFATAACTWLSFLAVQAEAALSPDTEPAHRSRAERVVARAVTSPFEVPSLR